VVIPMAWRRALLTGRLGQRRQLWAMLMSQGTSGARLGARVQGTSGARLGARARRGEVRRGARARRAEGGEERRDYQKREKESPSAKTAAAPGKVDDKSGREKEPPSAKTAVAPGKGED
jgi:hypothetical protein